MQPWLAQETSFKTFLKNHTSWTVVYVNFVHGAWGGESTKVRVLYWVLTPHTHGLLQECWLAMTIVWAVLGSQMMAWLCVQVPGTASWRSGTDHTQLTYCTHYSLIKNNVRTLLYTWCTLAYTDTCLTKKLYIIYIISYTFTPNLFSATSF